MAKDDNLDTLNAVQQPIEQAHGLANDHYIDPSVFDEEKHAVLFATWAGLAVTGDVPNAGDAKPMDFLGIPLLLIRDKQGAVRVFQNICRHRGMILASEPHNIAGAIRRPYHSWCYRTDGALVATPHLGGPGHNTHKAVDKSTLGLTEVRSHIWFDTVFINIDGRAAPFEDVHADLMARWQPFAQPMHHGGADSSFTLDVQTNRKLAVENYCESYHLPWVHPGLNSYSRLEDHYNIVAPGRYSGQGTRIYRQLTGTKGQQFPDFHNLPDHFTAGGEYVAVYPNVLLGVQRDHAFVIVFDPAAMDQTREHIHLYYADTDVDQSLRRQNAAQWKTVFEEDIFVVEGMYKGRHAPGFDGGRFSPAMDGPTHCFHGWVAGQMIAYRTR